MVGKIIKIIKREKKAFIRELIISLFLLVLLSVVLVVADDAPEFLVGYETPVPPIIEADEPAEGGEIYNAISVKDYFNHVYSKKEARDYDAWSKKVIKNLDDWAVKYWFKGLSSQLRDRNDYSNWREEYLNGRAKFVLGITDSKGDILQRPCLSFLKNSNLRLEEEGVPVLEVGPSYLTNQGKVSVIRFEEKGIPENTKEIHIIEKNYEHAENFRGIVYKMDNGRELYLENGRYELDKDSAEWIKDIKGVDDEKRDVKLAFGNDKVKTKKIIKINKEGKIQYWGKAGVWIGNRKFTGTEKEITGQDEKGLYGAVQVIEDDVFEVEGRIDTHKDIQGKLSRDLILESSFKTIYAFKSNYPYKEETGNVISIYNEEKSDNKEKSEIGFKVFRGTIKKGMIKIVVLEEMEEIIADYITGPHFFYDKTSSRDSQGRAIAGSFDNEDVITPRYSGYYKDYRDKLGGLRIQRFGSDVSQEYEINEDFSMSSVREVIRELEIQQENSDIYDCGSSEEGSLCYQGHGLFLSSPKMLLS